MKLLTLVVTVCLFARQAASYCCPNAKVYVANLELVEFLRSADRKLLPSDEVTQDDTCLTQRDRLLTWERASSGEFWEFQENFAEAEFTRTPVDFLGIGESKYWEGVDGAVPRTHRVIALKTATSALFGTGWHSASEHDIFSVCQMGIDWHAEDMAKSLEDQSGWFVILAKESVLDGWMQWREEFHRFAKDACGRGCLIGVAEDTGDTINDVQAALASVDTPGNKFKACVACQFVPYQSSGGGGVGEKHQAYIEEEHTGSSTKLQAMFWLVLVFLLV